MKQTSMVQTATLSLLLMATVGFGYAQHEGDRGGQDKQDHHAQPAGQQHGQPQQHAQQNQQQGRGQQQNARQAGPVQREQSQRQHRAQQQQRAQPQQRMQQSQQRNDWQQHRASNFESQHQSWSQRGGYRGDRVPDVNFRRNFGGNTVFVYLACPTWKSAAGHVSNTEAIGSA